MTPDETVYSLLCESGLKGTKVGWPVGGAPPLPWFTYERRKGGEVFADDSNYAKMRRYDVDLYQREADEAVQEAFETALSTVGPYACTEEWISSENCWVTSYTVTYHP